MVLKQNASGELDKIKKVDIRETLEESKGERDVFRVPLEDLPGGNLKEAYEDYNKKDFVRLSRVLRREELACLVSLKDLKTINVLDPDIEQGLTIHMDGTLQNAFWRKGTIADVIKAYDVFIESRPVELPKNNRSGFSVVEWGGCDLDEGSIGVK